MFVINSALQLLIPKGLKIKLEFGIEKIIVNEVSLICKHITYYGNF